MVGCGIDIDVLKNKKFIEKIYVYVYHVVCDFNFMKKKFVNEYM